MLRMRRLAALLLMVFVAAPRLLAEDLIQNGGFEQDQLRMLAMWSTEAYLYSEDAVRFFTTEQLRHSGRRSLVIANLKPNDARAVQWVKVKPDTLYRLSCQMMAQQVETQSVGANISVLGSTSAAGDLRDTGNRWEYVELYGRTGPAQESLGVLVRLGFYGSLAKGIALFDDVRLEEVRAVPAAAAGKVIDFAENKEDRIFRVMRAEPRVALRTLPAPAPAEARPEGAGAGEAEPGGAGPAIAPGGAGRAGAPAGLRWPIAAAALGALAAAMLVTALVALTRLGRLRRQQRAWPAAGRGKRGPTGKIPIQSLIEGADAQPAGPPTQPLGGRFSLRGRRRQDAPREIEHRGLARADTDAEALIRRAGGKGKAEVLKLSCENISDSGLYCSGPEPRNLFLDERVNVELTRGTRLVDLGPAIVVRSEAGHPGKGAPKEGGYGFCFAQSPEAIRKLRRSLYEAPSGRGQRPGLTVRAGALPP
jgi:hypothetical protein